MGALELSLDYRLRWMDFDRFGNLRPSAVLDLLQDTATVQAADMGIGREDMLARGVFWALVRVRYEVRRQPERFQKVKVRTWPHSPSRFSFLRDYQILDEMDNVLVAATSEWVLMDIQERSFARVSDICPADGNYLEERSLPGKPRKLRWPETETGNSNTGAESESRKPETFTVVPRFGDIDINGHVNNSCYPGYVMDAVNPQESRPISALQVDFRHEAIQGEPLQLRVTGQGDFAFAQGIRPDGEIAFNCKLDWIENPKMER